MSRWLAASSGCHGSAQVSSDISPVGQHQRPTSPCGGRVQLPAVAGCDLLAVAGRQDAAGWQQRRQLERTGRHGRDLLAGTR
jgi:hypothetical protein